MRDTLKVRDNCQSAQAGRCLAHTVSFSWNVARIPTISYTPAPPLRCCRDAPWRRPGADPEAAPPSALIPPSSQGNRCSSLAVCGAPDLLQGTHTPSYKPFAGFSFFFSKRGFIIYILLCKNFCFSTYQQVLETLLNKDLWGYLTTTIYQ